MSSAERSTKVVGLFEHHQDKRWQAGIAKLIEAYSTMMDAEEQILQALLEFGWRENQMSDAEMELALNLQARAKAAQALRDSLLAIAQDAATQGLYEDWESVLEGLPGSNGGGSGGPVGSPDSPEG